MRRVTATATRSGGWWAVEVPEVPGAFSQARRLEQIPAMAADAVEMLTGELVDVEVVPILPAAERQRIAEWRTISTQAAELAERAARESRALVAQLRAEGLSVRDVGELLGVSSQRVSQLAPAAATSNQPARKPAAEAARSSAASRVTATARKPAASKVTAATTRSRTAKSTTTSAKSAARKVPADR